MKRRFAINLHASFPSLAEAQAAFTAFLDVHGDRATGHLFVEQEFEGGEYGGFDVVDPPAPEKPKRGRKPKEQEKTSLTLINGVEVPSAPAAEAPPVEQPSPYSEGPAKPETLPVVDVDVDAVKARFNAAVKGKGLAFGQELLGKYGARRWSDLSKEQVALVALELPA